METRDKILEIVKAKGPVLPVQIAKEIGSDILMASAHLAELTASRKLRISAIKVGGSPLYYLDGQEAMLQKYIVNANDKEKKAYDMLNENKVLRDSEQEPVIRVALREIRDFAIPLNVKYNNNREIFWKWHLAGNEEAEQIIKSKLKIIEKPVTEPLEKIQNQEIKPAKIEDFRGTENAKHFPVEQKIEEKPIETLQKGVKQKKEPRKHKSRDKDDIFLKDVAKFFEKNKIIILSSEVVKRNSEIDFVVEIPSVVGSLQYYCKARNKKRISDSDLSNAYVKGQLKRLPVIVLSPGDLSAKAQEMIGRELSNLTFKKI